jgi:hypothetical protein
MVVEADGAAYGLVNIPHCCVRYVIDIQDLPSATGLDLVPTFVLYVGISLLICVPG